MLPKQPTIRRRTRTNSSASSAQHEVEKAFPAQAKAPSSVGTSDVIELEPAQGKVSARRKTAIAKLIADYPAAVQQAEAHANEPKINLSVEYVPVDALSVPERQLRKHSEKKIKRVAGSLRTFGLCCPIIADESGVVVDGVAVLKAAKQLGYDEVPVIRLGHLSRDQLRLYRIGVNKLSKDVSWDEGLLKLELVELAPIMLTEAIDPEIIGFDTAEFDLLTTLQHGTVAEPDEEELAPEKVAVSRRGDLWLLGQHRLYCGDAVDAASYAAVMNGERARMVFTDPPYNVPVNGHVSGLGKTKHREFVTGSGEMTLPQFSALLTGYMNQLAAVSLDGAIHFHCMDWRHIGQLIAAGEGVYGALKQLVVWKKTNAGMGTFYRSQHELIAVFKVGDAPHVNTFELGQTGRYRTNCWEYAGANAFGANRDKDLADHPTVKPTAMVMDAIKDVSHPGDIVLDCFGGSGTIILAAEKTRRRARAIELDPLYVDVAIRRWETLTGNSAVLAGDGRTFAEITADRLGEEVCDD